MDELMDEPGFLESLLRPAVIMDEPTMSDKLRAMTKATGSVSGPIISKDVGPSCEMCQKTYREVPKKSTEISKIGQLLRCKSCKKAFYCSKECQKAGWNKHKQACKNMRKEAAQSKIQARLDADNLKTVGGALPGDDIYMKMQRYQDQAIRLGNMNRHEEAVAMWRKVIAIDTDQFAAHINLGHDLCSMSDPARAIKHYTKGIHSLYLKFKNMAVGGTNMRGIDGWAVPEGFHLPLYFTSQILSISSAIEDYIGHNYESERHDLHKESKCLNLICNIIQQRKDFIEKGEELTASYVHYICASVERNIGNYSNSVIRANQANMFCKIAKDEDDPAVLILLAKVQVNLGDQLFKKIEALSGTVVPDTVKLNDAINSTLATYMNAVESARNFVNFEKVKGEKNEILPFIILAYCLYNLIFQTRRVRSTIRWIKDEYQPLIDEALDAKDMALSILSENKRAQTKVTITPHSYMMLQYIKENAETMELIREAPEEEAPEEEVQPLTCIIAFS